MPKLAPITATKLLKILRQLGFIEVRQRGSHAILKHKDGRETVVPVHQGEDLGRGLLRKILRDIKLSPDEFSKLR